MAGSLVIALIFAAWAGLVFVELDRQLVRYKEAQSDNRIWTLAQVETDMQRFLIALLAADRPGATPEAMAQVSRSFDILYSRVDLVRDSQAMDGLPLRDSPGWLALTGRGGLILRTADLIDHNPQDLPARLSELAELTQAALPDLRQALTDSLAAASHRGDEARTDLQGSLHTFSAAFGTALVVMALLLVAIAFQGRMLARHATLMSSAVSNLNLVIESSRDGVLVADGQGRLCAANRVAATMLGLDPEGLETARLSDHFGAEVAGVSNCTRLQTDCLRLGHGTVPVELSIVEAKGADGPGFRVAFLRDMSDQLERERRLNLALAAAREGEEVKSRFVTVISHEMRTPLNGLLSALELFESAFHPDAEARWLIEVMRGCGRTALEQVNNVLELAHLTESGGRGFAQSEFALGELLQSQVQQFQASAMLRNTVLTLEGRPMPDVVLRAPLQLLRRVLNNLLSNAVKFTEGGRIRLRCERLASAEGEPLAFRIDVEDTGIGISQSDLERIFHNFETLDTSYSRVQEGSGLGLGIAKLAAEALDGGIAVDSRLGEGSRFSFTFRAEEVRTPQVQSPLPLPAPHQGEGVLRILLAEDNAINRVLLQKQLERHGHDVTPVGDGLEAIEAVELDADFDVVLMDISMPRMDGLTATRHLRQGATGRHLPIIALTAQADQRRVAEFRAAGMDEILTKPVETPRLLATIARVAIQAASGFSLPTPAETAPAVEESPVDLAAVTGMLADMGAPFLQEMARRFEEEIAALLPELQADLAAEDWKGLGMRAHRSAGSAAVLGHVRLASALRTIEDVARGDQPGQVLAPLVAALPALWQSSEAAFAARIA